LNRALPIEPEDPVAPDVAIELESLLAADARAFEPVILDQLIQIV